MLYAVPAASTTLLPRSSVVSVAVRPDVIVTPTPGVNVLLPTIHWLWAFKVRVCPATSTISEAVFPGSFWVVAPELSDVGSPEPFAVVCPVSAVAVVLGGVPSSESCPLVTDAVLLGLPTSPGISL